MTAGRTGFPSLSALSEIGHAALYRTNAAGLMLLPVDKIREDRSQPRRHFDPAQLDELAASIRRRGVLQPIGVVTSDAGTYRIVFGARRYRACRLASLQVIPALVLSEEQATLDVQMIENVHRSDLRNSELVAGIIRMTKTGHSRRGIADLLGWDPERVKRCQALEGAPPIIWKILDGGTAIRAAYDLFYAWKKAPQLIEAAIGDSVQMSYADVRAVIGMAIDKPARAPAPEALSDAEVGVAPSAVASDPGLTAVTMTAAANEPDLSLSRRSPAQAPPGLDDDGDTAKKLPETASASSTAANKAIRHAPRFIVASGPREGVLVTTQASQKDDHALVQFDAELEDVPLSTLRFIAVTGPDPYRRKA